MKKLKTKIKNFFFCLRYPFWKSRNVFSGKFTGYSFTWYDDIPEGWRKAFGKELSDEIKKAGKLARKNAHKYISWRHLLHWEQIKEKWGELCLYASAAKEIMHVLEKYELLSTFYCINCGKPSKYRTSGYISYLCKNCFSKTCYKYVDDKRVKMSPAEIRKEMTKHKLAKDDIPKLTKFVIGKDGKMVERTVDLEVDYGIDVNKLVKERK